MVRKKQQGGVLPAGIIFVLVLLFLSSLAVDSLMIYAAANRTRSASRLAALAAIQAFYATKLTEAEKENSLLAHKARSIQAKRAAMAIFNETKLIVRGGGAVEELLIPEEEVSAPVPGQAYLMPGMYTHVANDIDEAEKASKCPPHDWFPECFKPVTPAMITGNPDITVNAVMIAGFTNKSFMPIFGTIIAQAMSIRVASVAAVKPRLFTFIIDRSASTTGLTHPDTYGPTESTVLGPNKFQEHQWWPSSFAMSQAVYDEYRISHPTLLRSDDVRSTETTSEEYQKRHYFSETIGEVGNDYEFVTIRNDASFNLSDKKYHPDPESSTIPYPVSADSKIIVDSSGPKNRAGIAGQWIVDMFRDGLYRGPEPFTSILEASSHAMDVVAQSVQLGDLVSLIAFGDSLFWPSIVLPVDDVAYVKSLVDLSPSERGLLHGIFPVTSSSYEFTNIELAFREFERHVELVRAERPDIEGVPILISDGIHNCSPCPLSGFAAVDCDANGYGCVSNVYGDHARAMGTLSKYMVDSHFLENYRSHILLLGSGAHRRNKSGPGEAGCMSMYDMAKQGISPAIAEESIALREEAFRRVNLGTGGFYYPSYKWWQIAYASGGEFIPVMQQKVGCSCDESTERLECSPYDIQTQIEKGLEKIFRKTTFHIAYSQ